MEVKPGYKQTEVGEIPEDWSTISMETITTHIGDGLHGTPVYSQNGECFFINGNNLNGRMIVVANDTKSVGQSEFVKHRKPLSDRSILMSVNGTVGSLGLYNGELVVLGKSVAYLNVKPQISKQFVYHMLQTQIVKQQFHDGLTGSTIGNLGLATIRQALIPLPPIEAEQRAIATALSDVDSLLDGLDRLISKKSDLKQAAMQQLLTGQTRLPGFEDEWEVKKLGDHVKFLRNGVNSRAELTLGDPVKYLHYGDIHGCAAVSLVPTELPSLPSGKAKNLDRLRDGDLVFADASEDLSGVSKSVEICRASNIELVSGLHTIAARFDKNFLADGFKAYLQFFPAFSRQLRRLAAGTKVYATNRSHIASVEMKLPGIEEQTAIATVFSDMDAELSWLEQRRHKTQHLKQGMMQELLTGKTRLLALEDCYA